MPISLRKTWSRAAGRVPAVASAASGASLTNHAIGNAMTIISTPRICSAARQPNAVVSQYASSGTIVPPTPIPRYAKPIALPRFRSNHRDKQHLIGQRAAADVSERVEQVAEIEEAQRRDRAEADQRAAGDQDADQHQPPRSEPVDDPAGQIPEHRSHQQPAERVARRHLPRASSRDPGRRSRRRTAARTVAKPTIENSARKAVAATCTRRKCRGSPITRSAARRSVVGACSRICSLWLRRGCRLRERLLDRFELDRLWVLHEEGIERVTARDQAVARRGGAVAERTAQQLRLQRAARHHVGWQLRIAEHEATHADDVGEPVPDDCAAPRGGAIPAGSCSRIRRWPAPGGGPSTPPSPRSGGRRRPADPLAADIRPTAERWPDAGCGGCSTGYPPTGKPSGCRAPAIAREIHQRRLPTRRPPHA